MTNDHTRSLLELLYHVSREVATALDLRTVLQRVLYAAIDNVGGERGSVVVMDDSGKPLDSIIVHGRRIQGDTTQQLRVTVERGLAGWVVRNQKPALVPDTSRDQRWLRRPDDAVQKSGAKAAICVPLMAREKIVGVMTLVHSLPNAFDRSHLELMQAIADQAGIAILNARLYTESQRQARVMTALADGAITINASLQMSDVFQRILNQSIQALQVETVALALQEQPSGDFVFRAATGKNAGSIVDKRVRAGEGIIGKVVKEGRGIVIPAIKEENPFANRSFFDGFDSHAIAVAPIQAQGKIIGVMEAINPISGVFDPDALLVMTGIGSLAGTTIQNAELFERVEETRKRYYELFNDSIDPILITDWDGNILEANKKALLLSGYNVDAFRTLKIDKIHTLNWKEVGEGFEYLRDDQPRNYESTLFMKDGKETPVEVHAHSVHFEDDEALQWIFRDITERKELDALRDDMTSMIYHDLRSPLSNVISSLDILEDILKENDDEGTAMLFKIATSSAARMQRLVSSLLDINRLEAGQPIVTQQGVSTTTLVGEALEAVLPGTQPREQKVNAIVPENIPNIWVDGDMIRRVLINLLENASKFTPIGGRIEVGVEDKGEWLQLWVQDTGIGIAPEDRQRVFEKFTRAKNKGETSGLGVGLAFCRLAITGHGGEIWVDENYQEGTRFNMILPVLRTTEEEVS
ncbi:MAG: GAF domain-containing protein [Anaerolineae bacterium]|jgi:two-component system, NtrC family, sensor histidine kinase KinB|nr:GAF domain-containing protein [Anaerolineae bacterium]MBT7072027.1 GAF domain-containing protein [Anaerolineae bacterium]MBT7324023.1 GAF domain-containing protein [Anaerolineae bacterium]